MKQEKENVGSKGSESGVYVYAKLEGGAGHNGIVLKPTFIIVAMISHV